MLLQHRLNSTERNAVVLEVAYFLEGIGLGCLGWFAYSFVLVEVVVVGMAKFFMFGIIENGICRVPPTDL